MASQGKIVKLLLVMVWVIFCAVGQMRAGETPALRDVGGTAVEWYVDDDGPGDPWPEKPNGSDPQEDGSINHPFHEIQEAINKATGGDKIIVQMGIYYENIEIKGKNIILTSTAPNDWLVVAGTVINGGGSGSTVTFLGTERTDCKLTGFTITGGYTGDDGGGIWGRYTYATIDRCIIENNISDGAGGGLSDCFGTISNCVIRNNNANTKGGGIAGCMGVFVNCLICNNTANKGGAINNSDAKFFNCTITSNTANSEGVLRDCDGEVKNCIIWDNSPKGYYTSTANFYYCCLEKPRSGTGNISVDPQFVSVDDFRIMPGSPCIDAGKNYQMILGTSVDLEGNNRFFDDPATIDTGDPAASGLPVVDMGSYEYNLTPRIGVSTLLFELSVMEGINPDDQILYIHNAGGGTLAWSISEDCGWLEAVPNSGISAIGDTAAMVALKVDISNLVLGRYYCELTVLDPCAVNNPKTVQLYLHVYGEIHVPRDFATIQAAIDAATELDSVVVSDGTYRGEGNRDIEFGGKAITVRSANGPSNCIIDCEGTESEEHRGFYFCGHEEPDSVLEGLTIINGYASEGGGIYCYVSSPTYQ